MDPPSQLRQAVAHLNAEGGFFNSLDLDRIAETASGLPWPVVQKVLDSCVKIRDDILDHTHYVCSELEKEKKTSKGGAGTVYTSGAGGGDAAAFSDQEWELWDRIGWMNTEGGFENSIRYGDVMDAAKGVETSAVMLILNHLEDKWQEVNDPTSWVCAALHKKRNGKGGKGGGCKGPEGQQWPAVQAEQWSRPGQDNGVRERVAWLNGEGGFKDAIKYDEIAAKASGVEPNVVMKILSNLVDKKGEVNDPTSWVCAALTKEQKGKGWQKGGGWSEPGWGQQPWQGHGPQQSWQGQGGGGQWQAPGAQGGDAPSLDRELRRKIAYLNNEGGFGNTITYREISEAAAGLDVSVVMRIFTQLEEKRHEIPNPTSFVISALWKERGSRGCGGAAGAKGSGKAPPPNVPAPPPVQRTIAKK